VSNLARIDAAQTNPSSRFAILERKDLVNGFATALSAWLLLAGPGKKNKGGTRPSVTSHGIEDRPRSGNGCRGGRDLGINSGDLCEFSCHFGFCPKTYCKCRVFGELRELPPARPVDFVIAWDESDVDLDRLCKFACKYGYCDDPVCTIVEIPEEELAVYDDSNLTQNHWEIRQQNWQRCILYKDPQWKHLSTEQCQEICKPEVDAAVAEGRTTNYGCVGAWPGEKTIPWVDSPQSIYGPAVNGKCTCDNWIINEFVDTFVEALPAIGQVSHAWEVNKQLLTLS
jgi:hypothetical protein